MEGKVQIQNVELIVSNKGIILHISKRPDRNVVIIGKDESSKFMKIQSYRYSSSIQTLLSLRIKIKFYLLVRLIHR